MSSTINEASDAGQRVVKPPGGDCHDVFGTDFSGSLPSNPHHRITKPPGGETNEIFTTPTSTPPSTPRKVKNYMASNIFTPDGQMASSNEQRAVRHRPDDDSFKRLFGANGAGGDVTDSPRKNHQKSSIIFADAGAANGKVNGTNGHGPSNGHGATNGTNGTNGHTNGHENGTPNGNSNGTVNGGSNGHVNGTNGHVNGGSNGIANGDSPKMNGGFGLAEANGKRIPPGGYSSKLW